MKRFFAKPYELAYAACSALLPYLTAALLLVVFA